MKRYNFYEEACDSNGLHFSRIRIFPEKKRETLGVKGEYKRKRNLYEVI